MIVEKMRMEDIPQVTALQQQLMPWHPAVRHREHIWK